MNIDVLRRILRQKPEQINFNVNKRLLSRSFVLLELTLKDRSGATAEPAPAAQLQESATNIAGTSLESKHTIWYEVKISQDKDVRQM